MGYNCNWASRFARRDIKASLFCPQIFDGRCHVAQATGALRVFAFAIASAFFDAFPDPIRDVGFTLLPKVSTEITAFMLKAVAHINIVPGVFDRDREIRLAFTNDESCGIAIDHFTAGIETERCVVPQFFP